MSDAEYTPPEVWVWENKPDPTSTSGGKWGSVNMPTSGARVERELPVGQHPLQLYSMGTPNGQKVTIMLEELLALGETGAEYDAHLIKIGEGDQFTSGFVALNPNSKIPVLLDTATNQRVFESGHIVLYLAEKFGHFIPTDPAKKVEAMNWLFWLQGSAPYLGGGFGHFYFYAPVKIKYAIDRFAMETKRQMDVLDQHLAQHQYLAGDAYSIADIVTWPWYGDLVLGRKYNSREFLDVDSYKNLRRWALEIAARPAVKRGRVVNKTGEDVLEERHAASDFDGINLE